VKLYALVPEVYEKIGLGPAVLGAYRSEEFDVMSRVVMHAMYFGRWQSQRMRVANEADPWDRVCQDVSFEALSIYVSENKNDHAAVHFLKRMGRL
jgi:hypothetical protein